MSDIMKAAISGMVIGALVGLTLCNIIVVKDNKIQQEQICAIYANELLHGSVDYRVMDSVSKVCQPYFEEKAKEERKQSK